MKNSIITAFSVLFGALVLFSGCDLEKTVDVNLPDYESQPLVECYLQPGVGYHVLLTRTSPYYEPVNIEDIEAYFEDLLINDASVSILVDDQRVELDNQLAFNPVTGSFSNYSSDFWEVVPYDVDAEFELEIVLADGKTITGSTRVLPRIEFDSIVVEFREPGDSLARVLTYFSDPPNEENYYRRMLHLDSLSNEGTWEQDFVATDEFNDQESIVFGSGFDYVSGDTLINTLFHIDQMYFDYLISIYGSVDANENPFAPGGEIITNLEGDADAIGIFTGLTFARDSTIIP